MNELSSLGGEGGQERPPIFFRDADGRTLLHLAALRGNAMAISALIASGFDVWAVDVRGQSVLHAAAFGRRGPPRAGDEAKEDNPGIIRLLVLAGLDIDHTDRNGNSPLHLACRGSTEAIIRALLTRGANPNLAAVGANTPLHLLSRRLGFQAGALQALLDHGADPRAKNEAGLLAEEVSSQENKAWWAQQRKRMLEQTFPLGADRPRKRI